MKNQYFGDINDFRKYGLLRGLSGPPLHLVVSWMLTPNDGRSDGKFTSYLSEPQKWHAQDAELFEFLRKTILVQKRRQVSALVESEMIPSARYVSVSLDGGSRARGAWLSETIQLTGPNKLVFFDPDNGLEVKSVSKRSKESGRYLYWEEVEQTWASGASILIYQHFIREKLERFLNRLAGEIRRRVGARFISVARTANVAFMLLTQARHVQILGPRMSILAERWEGQIQFETL